jgi:hypothetical protein
VCPPRLSGIQREGAHLGAPLHHGGNKFLLVIVKAAPDKIYFGSLNDVRNFAISGDPASAFDVAAAS